MQVGDLVKHKLNNGPWFGIITKTRLWAVGTRYFIEWQNGGSGWFRNDNLESVCSNLK